MSDTKRWPRGKRRSVPLNALDGWTRAADGSRLTPSLQSPYYRTMENELRALEERVGQIAAVARRLRAENAELRQALLAAQNESRILRDKVDLAATRVQRLLERLPEDAT